MLPASRAGARVDRVSRGRRAPRSQAGAAGAAGGAATGGGMTDIEALESAVLELAAEIRNLVAALGARAQASAPALKNGGKFARYERIPKGEQYQARVGRVACPLCSAPAGYRCRSESQAARALYHDARVRRARKP